MSVCPSLHAAHLKAADRCNATLKHLPVLFTTYSLSESLRGVYSPPQKITAEKENVSVQGIAAQFIYNAICGDVG